MAQLKDSIVTGDLRVTGKIYGTATNSDKVNNLTVLTAVPANAKFTDTTYSSKTAASGGTEVSLVTTGEKYTWNRRVYYGTCTTAGGTADKVADLEGSEAFTLETGSIVMIKMTNVNTASNPTLNVESTGAKSIMRYGTTAASTSANTSWNAGGAVTFVYDGTYWLIADFAYRGNDNTIPSAYSTTGAGTAAKVASFTSYNLLAKQYFMLVISTTNTVKGALTLNVNGKGAKPIYINGSASSASNYTMPAGTYLVYYDGTNYHLRTDGKIPNLAAVASSGSYNDLSNKPTIPDVSGKVDKINITAQTTQAVYPIKINAQGQITAYGNAVTSMTPSSHSHGNITNGGDITTTATIASGDRLVINDESASKVTNSSITFGTDTTTFLRNDGTWAAAGGGGDPLDAYPVGSIYMSVNNTSPATLFGGTWARIEDRFLLAATNPSASTVTYPAGSLGGAATVTLDTNTIPSHRHSVGVGTGSSTPGGDFNCAWGGSSTWSSYTGGGQAHNNMPPYLAVYMWQRTA